MNWRNHSTTDTHSASSTPIRQKHTMAATIWNMVSAFSPKGRVEGRCDMKFHLKISAAGGAKRPVEGRKPGGGTLARKETQPASSQPGPQGTHHTPPQDDGVQFAS